MKIVLAALLVLAAPADDFLTFQSESFSLQYPKKDSKLLPPSARVAFSLEYRKKSFLRLETERLLQPLDLLDPEMVTIFKEIQLERLRERVSASDITAEVRRYRWGPGVQFVYHLPARSGKKNERDKVVEILTTAGEQLFRLTYWVPQKELSRAEPVFQRVVESFQMRKAAPVASAAPPASLTPPPDRSPAGWTEAGRRSYLRFSVSGAREAAEDYRRALENDSPPVAAYTGLAEALGWKAYLEGGPSGEELQEMIRAAEKARRLAPDLKETQRALAYAAYHDNRMVEMEAAIHQAERIDPNDAESFLLEALWYEFNPAKARELAEEALRRNPKLVGAMLVKARAARKNGDLSEAMATLREAVSLEPSLVEGCLDLSEMAEELGDLSGALEAARSAVKWAPEKVAARFRLAVLLRRAGRPDDAVAEYRQLLKIDPRLPEAYYNLALIYLQEKKQPDLAARCFQSFLELDPTNEKAAQVKSWLEANGYR